MNQRYIDYANYNIWANNRLINNLLEQDDELLNKELVGSFPTIRATVSHIWFAETGWLFRLQGEGWKTSSVTNFTGTNKELFKEWQATSERFKKFVEKVDLKKEIQFEHKGENFSIPSREIVQTVFNHGSYHRGQVVMMMRQLGVSKISQTDYIEWAREKERGNI
ncbi:DNA polymerase [Galbibacter sp. EGI 63066]|uniref:DinB family protein n=1 Tax=Galbibacter sp. EGI 63066 TaxID=2993559 RepID=UPI002248AB3F|nr:DinB family protein [Galbibacter sp. EGI 63066]MCX2678732.1 DNA polymerase [Galbibacter sp. EGI 63066]